MQLTRYLTVAELEARMGSLGRDSAEVGIAIGAAESLIDETCGRWFDRRPPTPKLFRIEECSHQIWIPDAIGGLELVEISRSYNGPGAWSELSGWWSDSSGNLMDGAPHNVLGAGAMFREWTWLRLTPKVGWGWAQVPAPIKQAAGLHAAKLLKRRETPEGVMGFEGAGMTTIDRKGLDGDARALIAPFTRIETLIQ